jgi:hypothetical protein
MGMLETFVAAGLVDLEGTGMEVGEEARILVVFLNSWIRKE